MEQLLDINADMKVIQNTMNVLKKKGRPPKTTHRKTINISGTEVQIEKLRQLAKKEGQSVSQFIFVKTGVNNLVADTDINTYNLKS